MNFYTDILNQAYRLTKSNVYLWLFGMFAIGGFNLNFFYFRNFFSAGEEPLRFTLWISYLTEHPGKLVVFILTLLVAIVFSFVLSSWSRIMLILWGKSLLEKKYASSEDEIKKSKKLLWPVVQVGVITSLFMLAVAAAFALPMLFSHQLSQNLVGVLAVSMFLPLAFTIFCINIFTIMHVVVLRMPVRRAFNAGTDFFVVNWTNFLGLILVLITINFGIFTAAAGLLSLLKIILVQVLGIFQYWDFLQFSSGFIIIKALVVMLLWLLVGGLNAFFYTAILLFFLKKITPVQDEKKEEVPQIDPAPAIN